MEKGGGQTLGPIRKRILSRPAGRSLRERTRHAVPKFDKKRECSGSASSRPPTKANGYNPSKTRLGERNRGRTMAREFKLPDIGEGVHEGEITKWFVKEGDPVKENDPMVEVMTDKVTVQIPSPVSGRIMQLRAREGETVKVGTTLVVFGEAGETLPPKTTPAPPAGGLPPPPGPTPGPRPAPVPGPEP